MRWQPFYSHASTEASPWISGPVHSHDVSVGASSDESVSALLGDLNSPCLLLLRGAKEWEEFEGFVQ